MDKQQKIITNILMGIVDHKAAWVFEYQNGMRESFSMHTGPARQFMQGLQEILLVLEHQKATSPLYCQAPLPQPPPPTTQEGMWISDQAQVRLMDPRKDK